VEEDAPPGRGLQVKNITEKAPRNEANVSRCSAIGRLTKIENRKEVVKRGVFGQERTEEGGRKKGAGRSQRISPGEPRFTGEKKKKGGKEALQSLKGRPTPVLKKFEGFGRPGDTLQE